MVTLWLRCTIFPGQFSDEYTVKAIDANGREFCLLCPQDYIEFNDEPSWEKSVAGLMEVHRVDKKKDFVAIRLPRHIIGNGQYATVKEEQLVNKRASQRA